MVQRNKNATEKCNENIIFQETDNEIIAKEKTLEQQETDLSKNLNVSKSCLAENESQINDKLIKNNLYFLTGLATFFSFTRKALPCVPRK